MERFELTAQRREEFRKGPMGRLRKQQCIPGIIYGRNFKNINISIDNKNSMLLKKINFSENTLINLNVKDEKAPLLVLIKDCQIHPLTEEVTHIDFINVSLKEKIKVRVPIKVNGEAEGIKEGGMLQYLTKELEVECIPADIPESIEIDVTPLKVGESVHVGDLKVPEGIRLLNAQTDVVISVVKPEEEKEAAPVEGAAAEPEVIKEKPKTEEEGKAEEGKSPEGKAKEGKAKEGKAKEGKAEEPAKEKEKGKEKK